MLGSKSAWVIIFWCAFQVRSRCCTPAGEKNVSKGVQSRSELIQGVEMAEAGS